eukprot:9491811-Pyramimonas_sp.AAC.1
MRLAVHACECAPRAPWLATGLLGASERDMCLQQLLPRRRPARVQAAGREVARQYLRQQARARQSLHGRVVHRGAALEQGQQPLRRHVREGCRASPRVEGPRDCDVVLHCLQGRIHLAQAQREELIQITFWGIPELPPQGVLLRLRHPHVNQLEEAIGIRLERKVKAAVDLASQRCEYPLELRA